VAATVGTIPIAFYFLRRDAHPFSIFPSPCVDHVAAHPNFCRIAIGLIAARLLRLIGHKPSRVELLVQRQIGTRMRPMFLRIYRRACCDDNKRDEVPQGGVLPWKELPGNARLTAAIVIRKAQFSGFNTKEKARTYRAKLATSFKG
jgi:hypothetical protein